MSVFGAFLHILLREGSDRGICASALPLKKNNGMDRIKWKKKSLVRLTSLLRKERKEEMSSGLRNEFCCFLAFEV